MVFAPHWYDLDALFNKAFREVTVNVQGLSRVSSTSDYYCFSFSFDKPWQGMFVTKALYYGQRGARDNYTLQISNLVRAGYDSLGETPIVIGECGVPMDMKCAYL
jgi:hypothetical protein